MIRVLHVLTGPSRQLRRVFAASAIVLSLAPAAVRAQAATASLTDAEFWDLFTTRSERGGVFPSENFVSNEMTFQYVIPTLKRTLTPQGVYIGVGPEQNFTYIANLKPRLAVIIDIRRQNAMQHLMFKALFELSPNRAEFVSRLFSRPDVSRGAASLNAKALFEAAANAERSDSAYRANRVAIMTVLKTRHGFALAPDDSALIEQVYQTFYRAGTDINYGVRSAYASNTFSPVYPAFGELQQATNAEGAQMAFLANDENYLTVRDMQLRNLIVPVVGDFGGPSAIRSVGEYLRKKSLTVTAFYVSNVEQYLYRDAGASDRFYASVSALPFDSTSKIIRSVPPNDGMNYTTFRSGTSSGFNFGGMPPVGTMAGGAGSFSVTIYDSAGIRLTRVTQDSAGVPVTRTTRDSSGAIVFGPGLVSSAPQNSQRDSLAIRQLQGLAASADSLFKQMLSGPMSGTVTRGLPGGLTRGANLAVGLSGIGETLDAFFAGKLRSYGNAIEMTKTRGFGARVP